MIVDMHIHVVGKSSYYGNYIEKSFFNSWIFSNALKYFKINDAKNIPDKDFDDRIIKQVTTLLDDSILDYGMIFALDSAYQEDGTKDITRTQIIVSNDYIFEFAKHSKKVLCACSIHPYREDALTELDRCIKNGARAIKWIPSAQNIDLENERCIPFYQYLKEHHIPLIIHIGKEHTLKGYNQKFNDISKIVLPLKMGVTVIASHLGARLMLHERCFFKKWCRLTEKFNNLYGDISAFIVPTRTGLISKVLKSKKLSSRVIYGSDFPCINFPLFIIHKIGPREYIKIKKERNIFNEAYMCYKALGTTDEIFEGLFFNRSKNAKE